MRDGKILVTGKSGDGKSFSIRNLSPSETLFVRPTNKIPLPIRGSTMMYKPLSADRKTGNLITIEKPIFKDRNTGAWISKINNVYAIAKARGFKYVVIDDIQYILLAIEDMLKGSGDYKDSRKVYALIKQLTYSMFTTADMEADSITSIFLWQKLSTKDELVIPGDAFNEVVVPQGFFNIVLQAETEVTGSRVFRTNGTGLCKSPHEMLDEFIPNDILPVIKLAEEYYNENEPDNNETKQGV